MGPVSTVSDPVALAAIIPAWEALAANACEANPFYEPWILLPALRAQGAANFRCVLAWDGEALVGFLPFERLRRYKGLPVATLTSWRHSTLLLCTPLVRADAAVECLKALLASRGDASLFELRYLRADGPFAAALARALRTSRTPFATIARFSRALLRKAPSADAVYGRLSAHLRKDLRRKQRRLAEQPGYAEVVLGRATISPPRSSALSRSRQAAGKAPLAAPLPAAKPACASAVRYSARRHAVGGCTWSGSIATAGRSRAASACSRARAPLPSRRRTTRPTRDTRRACLPR